MWTPINLEETEKQQQLETKEQQLTQTELQLSDKEKQLLEKEEKLTGKEQRWRTDRGAVEELVLQDMQL